MVVELRPDEWVRAEPFFNHYTYQIPALAVIHGSFPGRVFVDSKEKPGIALVWALSRWSYISCSCKESSPEHYNFIRGVLDSQIIPLLQALGEKQFEIYADLKFDWDGILSESLSEYQLDKHYENTYTLNTTKFQAEASHLFLPEDVQIKEQTFPIIPDAYVRYASKDVAAREVFGMTLQKEGQIISQCLNNGFVHGDHYFIDLDTLDRGERNKGYGTLLVQHLIQHQLQQGLLPLWETTAQNLPSRKVASKLGFEKRDEYPVYSIAGF